MQWAFKRFSSLENKNENQNLIFKNRQHGILQHFKLILAAKADSTRPSLVVFRKFKRLISLVSAYRMVNNQICTAVPVNGLPGKIVLIERFWQKLNYLHKFYEGLMEAYPLLWICAYSW